MTGVRFRSVLITGASNGIGRALALAYAGPGVRLALSGRDAGRLERVAAECRALGAEAAAEAVDVADAHRMAAWVRAADDARPLDLVIANAGVSAATSGAGGDWEAVARRILAVNVEGVFNTALPALDRMRARRRGHVALMSSLAAWRGLPSAPAYGASKAAVKVWGEGLGARLGAEGIGVTVICPGFVRSAITDANPFPMPFLMETERAARIIVRGIAKGCARIAFPWPSVLGVRLTALLPPGLANRWLAGMPRREF